MAATSFSCGVCSKTVANNHNALCCDSCDKWVHIKCNFFDKMTYRKTSKGQFSMVLYKLHQGSTSFPISGKCQPKFTFWNTRQTLYTKRYLGKLRI